MLILTAGVTILLGVSGPHTGEARGERRFRSVRLSLHFLCSLAVRGTPDRVKVPHELRCPECNGDVTVAVFTHEHRVDFECPHCHRRVQASFSATLGLRIFDRATHEHISEKDDALTIVFAAMAFEAEMAQLHHKWVEIGELRANREIADEELDERLRRLGTAIAAKIDGVSRLMHPAGIDDFVATAASRDLRETMPRFPSLPLGSLATAFQRELFWPRNRVLHSGEDRFAPEAGPRALSIARLGLWIWYEMDAAKRGAS